MKLKITVHGVAYEVDVEVLDAGEGFPPVSPGVAAPRPTATPSQPAPSLATAPTMQVGPSAGPATAQPNGASSSAVTSPIAGTVHEVRCKPGDVVQRDDVLLVIEAMKMETSIAAPATGKVKAVAVSVGDSVREGQVLVEFD